MLGRELAEEGEPLGDVAPRQPVEFRAASFLLAAGDDFAEALDRIDGMGREFARRLLRARPQLVDLAPHQPGTETHRQQERQQRGREPGVEGGQDRQHGRRHQDRDAGRRDGVGEEILHHFHVLGCDGHQIAGSPAHQVGGPEPVQRLEERDAHACQQTKGDVMGQPGLRPVQKTRQGRRDRQPGQIAAKVFAGLQVQ